MSATDVRVALSAPELHQSLWPSSGWTLLERTTEGHLQLTDAFLRHLLNRPELALVAESCSAELAVHEALQANPRHTPTPLLLQAVSDADARENLQIWLRFRNKLLAAPTLEAAYMGLFAGDGVNVPPVFVQQLTQVLLAHVLSLNAGADAPINGLQARAADMLFRTQTVSVTQENEQGHTVMAADLETVERLAISGGFGSLGELLRQGGAPLRSTDLDVLSSDNEAEYLARSGGDAHNMAINLNHGQPGLNALCRVLEAWVQHFTACKVGLVVSREIDDERWVWHVGLDAQASAVLNALYQGEDVDDSASERMLSLFTLNFVNPHDMRQDIAGRPVYLAMAMDANRHLKLKPQNLLLNLPLAMRS